MDSQFLSIFSNFSVPVVIFIILLYGISKNTDVYDCFLKGSEEGLFTVFRIIPPLIGLYTAVSVFRASGLLEAIIIIFSPLAKIIGFPIELFPLAILRPISGSASFAVLADIFNNYKPDSPIGICASIMMGSTETIFYTLTVYLGSVGIKKIRYALIAALIAEFFGICTSIFLGTVLHF